MVAGGRELIDTLWNVNEEMTEVEKLRAEELIDTLWNVNGSVRGKQDAVIRELIDTLWNVNTRLTYCSINYLSAN